MWPSADLCFYRLSLLGHKLACHDGFSHRDDLWRTGDGFLCDRINTLFSMYKWMYGKSPTLLDMCGKMPYIVSGK